MEPHEEPGRDKLEGGELHVRHGKVWHWFDNLWYHYKWRIILAAIGIFAVLFLTLSTCRRREPDYYFYYVGPGEFTGAQQSAIITSLGTAAGEDGQDAKIAISFLFVMTNDQIQRFSEEHADDGLAVSGAQIMSNRELLADEIKTGNAILFFMDPEVLEETQSSSGAFLEIKQFAPEGTPEQAFSGEYGIKLSYTRFAYDPAFAAFPKDTVIAIRNGISALSLFQRDKALENRARYEALLRKWLILD